MTYAAVVVLHESRDALAALLASLPAAGAARLVVVDTGRDDGGADLARAHGAELIERRDNPGFGAATNAGVERVGEDITILLNPDIEAAGDTLARLARLAREHDALHAPRLLNRDGSVQRSAHPLPGTAGAFLPALLPWLPRAIRERAEPYRGDTARSVGWAIAACLAARTETLRRFPFDPSIHLFAEDMDVCLRARRAGVRTVYHPQLTLIHTGRHSVGEEPYVELARNRRRVLARHGRARLDDVQQLLTFAARAAVKRPNDKERAQLSALLEVLRSG